MQREEGDDGRKEEMKAKILEHRLEKLEKMVEQLEHRDESEKMLKLEKLEKMVEQLEHRDESEKMLKLEKLEKMVEQLEHRDEKFALEKMLEHRLEKLEKTMEEPFSNDSEPMETNQLSQNSRQTSSSGKLLVGIYREAWEKERKKSSKEGTGLNSKGSSAPDFTSASPLRI
ncbi:hypothetical protein BC829DRAFT_463161 [Chytridium lagenaria]|nr:hypothetical protein BC829DRAFT_463161 [Chytridium lagenaria]